MRFQRESLIDLSKSQPESEARSCARIHSQNPSSVVGARMPLSRDTKNPRFNRLRFVEREGLDVSPIWQSTFRVIPRFDLPYMKIERECDGRLRT